MKKPLTTIYNLAISVLLSGVAFAAVETEMPSDLEAGDRRRRRSPIPFCLSSQRKLSIRL